MTEPDRSLHELTADQLQETHPVVLETPYRLRLRQTYRVRPVRSLNLRLAINPTDAEARDDRFILQSVCGTYEEVRTVKDDVVPLEGGPERNGATGPVPG